MPTTADAVRMRTYWRNVPDRRSATYYRRMAVGPPATYATSATIYNLWHREFKNNPHPGNPGVYVVYEADLYFPKETNASYATTSPPLPGDQIQDAAATTIPYTGKRWTVSDVQEAGGQGTWKLHAVAPAIISAVGIAVLIQSATNSISTGGLRVPSWSTVTNGSQTAWVQDTPTNADDVIGKRQIPANGTLYLSTPVDIDAQCTVLVVSTGERYSIVESRPVMNFIDLMELDVELLH